MARCVWQVGQPQGGSGDGAEMVQLPTADVENPDGQRSDGIDAELPVPAHKAVASFSLRRFVDADREVLDKVVEVAPSLGVRCKAAATYMHRYIGVYAVEGTPRHLWCRLVSRNDGGHPCASGKSLFANTENILRQDDTVQSRDAIKSVGGYAISVVGDDRASASADNLSVVFIVDGIATAAAVVLGVGGINGDCVKAGTSREWVMPYIRY